MVTKEELEKSTFVGRHVTVWFMFSCTLVMFILDGIVYKVEAPPGESDWEYGPSVFLMCLVRASDGRWDAMRCEGGGVAKTRAWRRRAREGGRRKGWIRIGREGARTGETRAIGRMIREDVSIRGRVCGRERD